MSVWTIQRKTGCDDFPYKPFCVSADSLSFRSQLNCGYRLPWVRPHGGALDAMVRAVQRPALFTAVPLTAFCSLVVGSRGFLQAQPCWLCSNNLRGSTKRDVGPPSMQSSERSLVVWGQCFQFLFSLTLQNWHVLVLPEVALCALAACGRLAMCFILPSPAELAPRKVCSSVALAASMPGSGGNKARILGWEANSAAGCSLLHVLPFRRPSRVAP